MEIFGKLKIETSLPTHCFQTSTLRKQYSKGHLEAWACKADCLGFKSPTYHSLDELWFHLRSSGCLHESLSTVLHRPLHANSQYKRQDMQKHKNCGKPYWRVAVERD